MLKKEIEIGAVYSAKVSGSLAPVRIDSLSTYGGWNGTNLATHRTVRIKSAAKLRKRLQTDRNTKREKCQCGAEIYIDTRSGLVLNLHDDSPHTCAGYVPTEQEQEEQDVTPTASERIRGFRETRDNNHARRDAATEADYRTFHASHFRALADTLRLTDPGAIHVLFIADILERRCPNFDRARFLTAVGPFYVEADRVVR